MVEDYRVGIRFEFPNTYDRYLEKLFENISVKDYTWYVLHSESYIPFNEEDVFFLPEGIYSGEDFLSKICLTPEYYLLWIKIFAVPNEKKFYPEKINSYKDYVESPVTFCLTCDERFSDFYSKNDKITDIVFKNCCKYFNDYELVTPHYIISSEILNERFIMS